MYHNVMQYVDRVFNAVRPRRVLFLAIDGIAPRAKMNQQRVRRFRSAQEARERQAAKDDCRRCVVSCLDSVVPSAQNCFVSAPTVAVNS